MPQKIKIFYKHRGFDPFALLRSLISNVQAGKVVQGGSTLTQQLARILFLSTERTIDRKLKELIIAYRLEKTISKDEILEMYLNNVYLGEGAYGVSAAAEIYFNKKVKDLNLQECALIAGLPQAPSAYSPYQNMKYAKERRRMVLTRMANEGFITEEQATIAARSSININKKYKPYLLNKAPYFVDYIKKEVERKAGISESELIQGGYKVYTTLNYKYQKIALDVVRKNLSLWRLNKPQQQAALVSFDVISGKILAYIGGKDYRTSQFDRVSQAIRQPGSSFKVFVYTAAVENGFTPNDIYTDEPVKIGDWGPRNYGNIYKGDLYLYEAMAFSSNVIAAKLIKDIGVRKTINVARRLGITTNIAKDPTIALGSSGVKLLELTSAYGVFANGGIKISPYAVERIETSNGRVIYQASNSYDRVLDPRTVSNIVTMLKQVVNKGTGRGANIRRPAAGKTGTTDSYRDAWFIGFTPEFVTGVWVGNDNNKPTAGLTGGSIPATIWNNFMKKIEQGRPVKEFTYPDIILENKKKEENNPDEAENPMFQENINNFQDYNNNYKYNNNNQRNFKYEHNYNKPVKPLRDFKLDSEFLREQERINRNNQRRNIVIPSAPPIPDKREYKKYPDKRPLAPPIPDQRPYIENSGF